MSIAISSGHGLKVSGAVGVINEVTEARRVVAKVTEYLRSANVTVAAFNDDTSTTQAVNLNTIVKFHNAQSRDLDVSVHFNASKKTDAPVGVEVLYYSEKDLAAKVSKAIASAAGLKDRGAKLRTDLAFLNGTKKPAILIEVCFVDSAADVKLYQANFDAICRAIAETISGKKITANDNTAAEPPKAESIVKFDLFGQKTVEINGSILNGVTHVQARQLLEAMEFDVYWNETAKIIEVRLKGIINVSGEELDILQKIVQAEAGGEDHKGKVLVTNVIFNRVNNKGFQNTIKDVVFAPNQFEPTRNGAYERAVASQGTIKAVQEALSGVDYSGGALYFRTIKGATPDCWHETALTPLFDHGCHRFYI